MTESMTAVVLEGSFLRENLARETTSLLRLARRKNASTYRRFDENLNSAPGEGTEKKPAQLLGLICQTFREISKTLELARWIWLSR